MSNNVPLANCSAEEWTFNSKGESPCYLAAELAKTCSGGVFGIPLLPQDQNYLGPEAGKAPSCRCNTVFYSLLSACAHCQQRSWINWNLFKSNCSTTYTEFPEPLPAGLVVPNWAFDQVYEDGGAWIAPRARAIEGEQTGTPRPRKTDGSVDIGAIVGGVAGGVGFLIITGLVVFFLLRRRRRRRQEAERIDILGAVYPHDTGRSMAHTSGGTGFPPVSHFTGTTIVTTTSPPPRTSTTTAPQTMKLYNPDDPSTWPHNYSMYPSTPDPSIPASGTNASTTPFTSFSSSGMSTNVSAPLLPELTGVSASTAVTHARTTMGDNSRYRNIEF
ncbi:hypothetical protein CC2G_005415 [Coprinopsis cinerea AmutBmut pab1-1]|nr:hypothetical protein CC2G_005415 [Coprinopsis cinerea AmutBmut pab1-1]